MEMVCNGFLWGNEAEMGLGKAFEPKPFMGHGCQSAREGDAHRGTRDERSAALTKTWSLKGKGLCARVEEGLLLSTISHVVTHLGKPEAPGPQSNRSSGNRGRGRLGTHLELQLHSTRF